MFYAQNHEKCHSGKLEFTTMIAILFCFISFLHYGCSNGPECCSKVTDSECKNACTQLSPTATQVEQISYLASVANFCPANLVEFWQCAGRSSSVLEEMSIFSGRPCCNFTKSRLCREACIQAESEEDIETHCSRNTEDKLYSCIARQKDGEKCCSRSSPHNPNCMSTCWHMYLSNSLTMTAKKHLREMCKGGDRPVYQCVQKQTQSAQTNSLHCCEKADDESCKEHCIAAFKKHNNDNDILDMVQEGCGTIRLLSPLYQCFLREEPPKSDVTAIDAAKLHCCEKATSNMCADMCVKTHNNQWSSIGRFEKNCGYMSSPVATMETLMHDCLKEVEEPCQLGCSGLSYCTNFNNRPTGHFRSCTAEADQAARDDILLWQKGTISLPNLQIPVKDIRECEPEMWKAIACSLQIKPCYKTPTPLQICREDCEYILGKCVDTTKLKSEGKVVKDLCNRLPKTDTEACISVQKYLTESPHKWTQHEVTQPCKSHPCGKDEICHVKRRKCKHSHSCPHFVCRKACPMGHASKLLVPQSSNVIIPEYPDSEAGNSCQFYKICHCGHKGSLSHCRQMDRCIHKKHCMISTGVVKAHQEYFTSDCNDCVCFDGEKVCTKKTCLAQLPVDTEEQTGIQNCDCSRTYDPVCASNGKTYPSACIAKCVGQEDYQKGSCHSIDPCHTNPCQEGYICVPHRKVCYGPRNSPCDQYECISLSEECNHHHHDPVCDTRQEEFVNTCVMLSKSRQLDFRGHCPVTECSRTGLVCGHNGETYVSECAALADRTTVDYTWPCRTFGLIEGAAGEEAESVCKQTVCPEVVPSECEGIIPPWGCCPVCAAELRTLSSETLARMVGLTIKKGPISVQDIVKTLSDMVTVSECDVFGYLGLEGEIVILVAAITQNPTSLQVQACFKEAERFEYLIKSRSPTITSNMLLTPLLHARLRTPVLTVTNGVTNCAPSIILLLTPLILLLSHKILGFV